MKKAVILARVSSKDQRETGYSLPAQRRLLTNYSIEKDFQVTKLFSISETASKHTMRKTYNEAINFIKKEKINILVVEKVDRLTRNYKDASAIDDWLNADLDNEVHFVKESLVIKKFSPAHEKFIWNMKVAVAKLYTDNLSEEVLKGKNEKLQNKKYPGAVKLGYISRGVKKIEHIPDPEKAPLLVKCFELFSTGEYTIEMLCNEAYKIGLLNKNGNKISKSAMHRYLTDPFYCGDFIWRGVLYKNADHEPIITKELFELIQHVLNRKPDAKYRKHFYPFKGIVTCGECGGMISWYEKKGHVYGRCNHYKPCKQNKCGREDLFKNELKDSLDKLKLDNPALLEVIKNDLIKLNRDNTNDVTINREKLNNKVKELEKMIDEAYEDKLSGLISKERYQAINKKLESEKTSITSMFTDLSKKTTKSREIGIMIFDLAKNGSEILEYAKDKEMRTLINMIFNSIELKDRKLDYAYSEGFMELHQAIKITNSSKALNLGKIDFNNFEPGDFLAGKVNIGASIPAYPKIRRDRDSNPGYAFA